MLFLVVVFVEACCEGMFDEVIHYLLPVVIVNPGVLPHLHPDCTYHIQYYT